MMSQSHILRVGMHKDHYLAGKLEGKKITITRITDYWYFSQRVPKNLPQPITITLQEVVFPQSSSRWKFMRRNYRPAFYIWPSTTPALSLNYILPVRNGFRYFVNDLYTKINYLYTKRKDFFHEWEGGSHPLPTHIVQKMKRMIEHMTQKELDLWLILMSPEYDPRIEIPKP